MMRSSESTTGEQRKAKCAEHIEDVVYVVGLRFRFSFSKFNTKPPKIERM